MGTDPASGRFSTLRRRRLRPVAGVPALVSALLCSLWFGGGPPRAPEGAPSLLAAASAAPAPGRFAVIVDEASAEAGEVAAALVAFRDAPWPGAGTPAATEIVVRRTDGTDDGIRAALVECATDGADLLVVLGDAAGRTPRNSVRGRPVVPASVLPPVSGTTDVSVAAGPLPADLLRHVAAFVADPSALVYVLPPDGAVPTGLAREFRSVRLTGATPRERAAAARADLVPGRDAVVLDARVSDDDAAAVAAVLRGSGTPLVGLRRGHLAAGCSGTIASRGKDVGAVAAVAALEAFEGRAARNAPPRTPRGVVREVHLGHARRAAWQPPLTLLAQADRVVPAGDVLR